jgi:hypothetical protein
MENFEKYQVKPLTSNEKIKHNGGWAPLLWMIAGYVIGEVLEGVYQAQQKGCFDIDYQS